MSICERCGKEHDGSFATGRFCSRACANGSRHTIESRNKISQKLKGRTSRINGLAPNRKPRTLISPICIVCSKVFTLEVVDSDSAKQNARKTCSDECAHNFKSIQGRNSAAVQAVTRRSKNEIAFATMCQNHFGNTETNERMFNGWDADVILKDQQVAILWNGKWHYEKITKSHSVCQVQNRDRIKIKEIEKAGFTPYVIKDLGGFDPVFVEQQFGELVKWLSHGPHKAG